MTDYTKLVKAFRYCAESGDFNCNKDCPMYPNYPKCLTKMDMDAAAAIEALEKALIEENEASDDLYRISCEKQSKIEELQAEVKRLKECNDELREAQTYIDHYGDKWLTSAKDVPTAAYEHGYADGRDEAEAQLPKRGGWERELDVHNEPFYQCSVCGECFDSNRDSTHEVFKYCPDCGAKMEVQDG